MQVTDYSVWKLSLPVDPPISDATATQGHSMGVSYLELETDTGEVGIGVGGASLDLPAVVLEKRIEGMMDRVLGESPFHLLGRMNRPRGFHYSSGSSGEFDRIVDLALWDLCGKHLEMPLYELLGGEDPVVPAYASGLAFSHDDETTRTVYERFKEQGFDAAKVKVGYPTIEEDIDRLALVREVLGSDCTLMVDANEAWSPKEAIRRAHAYRDAGFDLDWIEDPVLRDDVTGITRVAENTPFAHINGGEYVNLEGKRELLEHGAVDILNLRNGLLSTSLKAATVAHSYGVLTHVGDTHCEIGVHLAAALPETTRMEYWMRPWETVTDRAVAVEDGNLIAPDRSGHGVTVSGGALDEFAHEL